MRSRRLCCEYTHKSGGNAQRHIVHLYSEVVRTRKYIYKVCFLLAHSWMGLFFFGFFFFGFLCFQCCIQIYISPLSWQTAFCFCFCFFDYIKGDYIRLRLSILVSDVSSVASSCASVSWTDKQRVLLDSIRLKLSRLIYFGFWFLKCCIKIYTRKLSW